jgi:hypothetical protein
MSTGDSNENALEREKYAGNLSGAPLFRISPDDNISRPCPEKPFR